MVDLGDSAAATVAHLQDLRGLVTPAEEALYDPRGSASVGQGAGEWPAWGDISLGPFRWKRALMYVYNSETEQGAALLMDGAIGTPFWRHFRMTLDLHGNRLWLKQEVPFGEHEDDCTFGLQFTRAGGSFRVRSLQSRGPAALAGLREGDLIRSINGVPTDGLSVTATHSACEVGKPLTLQVIREGKPLSITTVATPIP